MDYYFCEIHYTEEWIEKHSLIVKENNNDNSLEKNNSSGIDKDLDVLHHLVNEDRSVDYIWYYLNHMHIEEFDDDLISIRSHIYEIALQRGMEKVEAKKLACEYYPYRYCSFHELEQEYPEKWQKELIASIFCYQFERDWIISNEEELVSIYIGKFVDATGDKMISDIKFETYIEYNRRYPDGSGDELMYSMGLVEEYYDEDDIEYYKRSLKYFDEYGGDE